MPRHAFLSFLYVAVRRLLELLALRRKNDEDKDVEILVLRHQPAVLRRQVRRPIFLVSDRAFLAAGSRVLSRRRWAGFSVRPETLLRCHRDLVAGNWTRPLERRASWAGRGGPRADPPPRSGEPEVGCVRIRGELLKLGIKVSATTIATLLRRYRLGPNPRRGLTWGEFLSGLSLPRIRSKD